MTVVSVCDGGVTVIPVCRGIARPEGGGGGTEAGVCGGDGGIFMGGSLKGGIPVGGGTVVSVGGSPAGSQVAGRVQGCQGEVDDLVAFDPAAVEVLEPLQVDDLGAGEGVVIIKIIIIIITSVFIQRPSQLYEPAQSALQSIISP